MKIAVTYENGQIFQHFGHTEAFKIYDVENGEIKNSQVVDTSGSGHCALGAFLADMGVEVLICGGIGPGAQNALYNAGIRLFGGVQGDADAAVNALIKGELDFDPDAKCTGHEDGEHSCHDHGDHDCHDRGDHDCGGHGNCGNH